MPKPTVCVLRAPGTNCDVETAFAFEAGGAQAERLHLFRLLDDPQQLSRFQILCIPGGFSYGDDIGAGVIFSRQLQGRLAEALAEFLHADTLALGICNGFQVLLKSGVLPGGGDDWGRSVQEQQPSATLTWNDNGTYTALWVHLSVESTNSVFLQGIERIDLPIAHAEGKLVVRDAAVVDQLDRDGQIALRYSRQNVEAANSSAAEKLPFPANPNGSVADIAGLSDPTGRILGLMPHPERFLHATQHPQWTRTGLAGDGDGLRLFRNAVDYFR